MDVEALQKLIEQKFAPEPLLAVQGLANTHATSEDEELLPDPEGARRWLLQAGLIDADAGISAKDHEELLELRQAVRDMLGGNHDGATEYAAVATLRRLAAEHPVEFEVTDSGEVRLDLGPASSGAALIAQLVGIIGQSQGRDEWERLKICPDDSCSWAFYDSSKNRGGVWCSMGDCGNREKNRRYRERQKQAG